MTQTSTHEPNGKKLLPAGLAGRAPSLVTCAAVLGLIVHGSALGSPDLWQAGLQPPAADEPTYLPSGVSAVHLPAVVSATRTNKAATYSLFEQINPQSHQSAQAAGKDNGIFVEADFLVQGALTEEPRRDPWSLAARLAATQADFDDEVHCLALNIYHEARNEPEQGKLAVAHVVLNRVADPRFPSTACEVIRQGGERVLNRCQFSWWCDGRSDDPKNRRSWQVVKAMAHDVYWGNSKDPTGGALWYHADYVSPSWGRVFKKGPTYGRHIFYQDHRSNSTQVASSR